MTQTQPRVHKFLEDVGSAPIYSHQPLAKSTQMQGEDRELRCKGRRQSLVEQFDIHGQASQKQQGGFEHVKILCQPRYDTHHMYVVRVVIATTALWYSQTSVNCRLLGLIKSAVLLHPPRSS